MFIHHDSICGTLADYWTGSGCFDVLQVNDGFYVFDNHAGLHDGGTFETLEAANAHAEGLAKRWDAL